MSIPTRVRWGIGLMGHMVDGHMGITSLILQGSSPKFYSIYIWRYSF